MTRKTITLKHKTQSTAARMPCNDTTKKFCPHCHNTVNRKTFRRHKAQFYNEDTRTWKVIQVGETPLSAEGSYIVNADS